MCLWRTSAKTSSSPPPLCSLSSPDAWKRGEGGGRAVRYVLFLRLLASMKSLLSRYHTMQARTTEVTDEAEMTL